MGRLIILGLAILYCLSNIGQTQTTTPSQIKADFTANCPTGTFPRLYTGSTELARFKSLVQSGDAVAVATWNQIKSDAEAAINKTIPDWYLDAANLRVTPIHDLSKTYIPQLAVAYLITSDSRYAAKGWAIAQKMMSYPDWGASPDPNYCDRHFLDAGIAGFNVAMIYDAFYNYLTSDQRLQLYQATRRLLLVPALARYKGQVSGCSGGWNWADTNNNWNGICNGGVISACLTMFENEPDFLSDIVSRGINKLKPWITAFEPDGQSVEGMSYWSYGLMYTVTAFDIMKRTLGSTYGYADTPGMKKTGYFPLFTSGPVATLNIGDDGIKNSRQNTILWFAKYLNDNSLAKLYYDNISKGNKIMPWFDMFNYNPYQVSQGTSPTTPLDNYISGIAIHSFVERWQDANAMYIGIHGGSNTASHGHLDAGTFDIQALGQIWTNGNLGPDNYTYPGYFSSTTSPAYNDANAAPTAAGRWHFYRLRAEGKNCLIFNPDYRPDQNEKASAQTSFFSSETNQGTVSLDLSEVYSRDVNAYKRAYRLNRLHRVITIQDTYSVKENQRIWWNIHTKASGSISSDGQSAILTLNGKQLKAIIRFPHDAKFQISQATYLDGRSFPLTTNSSNSSFQKLGICLPSAKDGLIRVDFLPTDGETGNDAIIDNFEGFAYGYASSTADGNIDPVATNPQKDVINASNTVLKFSINASVQTIPSLLSPTRSFVTGTGIGQYRFLKMNIRPDLATDFRLKLTNSKDNTSAEFAALKAINQTNVWQELDFDLSKDINGVSTAGKTFDGIILTPIYSVTGNAVYFYLDDLTLTNTITSLNTDDLFRASAPSGLKYLYRTSNTVKLQWDALPGAVSYNVYSGSTLLTSTLSSPLQLSNLPNGSTYQFKITGVNANQVESDFSATCPTSTRSVTAGMEILDNFEGLNMPWTPISFATVSRTSNPLKDITNQSNSVLKVDLNNPSNNYSGAALTGELFTIPGLRYLHFKLLRPASTDITKNASIKLIQPNTDVLSNEKEITAPLNSSALTIKNQWVDYVFDLGTSNTSGIYWNSFFIMPERISNPGSLRTYYVDDVLLSNDPSPIVSIINDIPETSICKLKILRQVDGIHLVSNEKIIRIDSYDMFGKNEMTIYPNNYQYTLTSCKQKIQLIRVCTSNNVIVKKIFSEL